MKHIDSIAIEQRARRLRAEEIRRIEGIFAARLRIVGRLLASSLFDAALVVAGTLRTLFSWNPQELHVDVQPASPGRPHIALSMRINRAARALFAWNPMARHH